MFYNNEENINYIKFFKFDKFFRHAQLCEVNYLTELIFATHLGQKL